MSEGNYIKMDGEVDGFSGGAIRYSKKGKGRYDLIPCEVVYLILGYGELMFRESNIVQIELSDIVKDAYIDDDKRYIQAIIDFIAIEYAEHKVIDTDFMLYELSYNQWLIGLMKALKDLAIHYEYGAEKYGVDNWKNGIPRTGGERGGSFTDSGLRHLNQYMLNETDEKHGVAFMWNFVNAIYLQLQENNNTVSEEYHKTKELKEILDKDMVYTFGDDDITD